MSALSQIQRMVGEHVEAKWSHETIMHAGLGLSEECGELMRCILKREHGTRGTPEQWTAELRKEAAQVGVVLLDIAHREGFDLFDEIVNEARAFTVMDPNHDPLSDHP